MKIAISIIIVVVIIIVIVRKHHRILGVKYSKEMYERITERVSKITSSKNGEISREDAVKLALAEIEEEDRIREEERRKAEEERRLEEERRIKAERRREAARRKKEEAERIRREEEERKAAEERRQREAEELKHQLYLQELERERREREEAERKIRLYNSLKQKVTQSQYWWNVNGGDMGVFPLYYYYPTSVQGCGNDTRYLIWNFKDGVGDGYGYKYDRYRGSVSLVVSKFKIVLKYFFGNNVSDLTLFCIPASTRYAYRDRCQEFASDMCSESGMQNGYPYVTYIKDGMAKHLNNGEGVPCEVSLDRNFWDGRMVIMFDDVITRGESMMKYKRMLENAGARVVGGITIGVTKHTIMSTEPFNAFYANR